MRKIHITAALFLLFFLSIGLLIPQQEVVMRIREGMPVIPVAVPEIITNSGSPELDSAASTLREVIISDLKYSRVFSPLPEDYYKWIKPLDPENIIFKDWESIQAKLLISGEMSQTSDGSLLFEAKLYDVKSARFIKGKKYQSDKSLLRLVGHRLSNELMITYGEPPLFTTKILFVSNRNGNDELYMMDYDGYNQTRLTFNKTRDYMPAWSADGKTIAYTAYSEGKAALYLFNPFEGTRTMVTDQGTSFGPDFSYDGKRMTFCSTEDESNSEIYVADSSGKNIKRLTFNNAIDTAPSWSPNNREIAFTSDRLGSPQIYIMDAEGTNVRRRSFGGNYHDGPAWAPTGDRIVYVSRVAAVFDLYVLNLRTDRIIKLTEGYSRNESPSWSPDGRHIIFSSNRTGTIQIYSLDYDGTNLRRLTSKGENKLPNWSRK
jgi:TolB protein